MALSLPYCLHKVPVRWGIRRNIRLRKLWPPQWSWTSWVVALICEWAPEIALWPKFGREKSRGKSVSLAFGVRL
jgi:hypothetical protein